LTGKSVLFIGRPGAGKTTLLREMAHALSRVSTDRDTENTVVVVDKINEIAGDFEVPHACIGEARWMPCGSPEMHPKIMNEALENAAADVVLVDEVCTGAEVDSACNIAQRRVRLIATVHGNTIVDTINCSVRQRLIGGIRRMPDRSPRNGRSVREASSQRLRFPAFDMAIELHQKERWVLHPNLRYAVDMYLEGSPLEAVELRPGLALATVGIPVEDGISYCYECTANRRCRRHRPSQKRDLSPAPSQALERVPSNPNLLDADSMAFDSMPTPRTPSYSARGMYPREGSSTPRRGAFQLTEAQRRGKLNGEGSSTPRRGNSTPRESRSGVSTPTKPRGFAAGNFGSVKASSADGIRMCWR